MLLASGKHLQNDTYPSHTNAFTAEAWQIQEISRTDDQASASPTVPRVYLAESSVIFSCNVCACSIFSSRNITSSRALIKFRALIILDLKKTIRHVILSMASL
ncbi:hypothetical protein SETIT_5G043100v2 [Setaria italica]|uniref:Uncharacterized protein n=1 Tax=Setaria italica TaxID=4555 RepID=A0A368R1B0_SETIT|nr:hypothetical protein SETIT_5G043100v2 [Setaria italica]